MQERDGNSEHVVTREPLPKIEPAAAAEVPKIESAAKAKAGDDVIVVRRFPTGTPAEEDHEEVLKEEPPIAAPEEMEEEVEGAEKEPPAAPAATRDECGDAAEERDEWSLAGFERYDVFVARQHPGEALGISLFTKKMWNGHDVIPIQRAKNMLPGSMIVGVNNADSYAAMCQCLDNDLSLNISVARKKQFEVRIPDVGTKSLGLKLFAAAPQESDVTVRIVSGDGLEDDDGSIFWGYNAACAAGDEVVKYDKLTRLQTGDLNTAVTNVQDVRDHFKAAADITGARNAATDNDLTVETIMYWVRPAQAFSSGSGEDEVLNLWKE